MNAFENVPKVFSFPGEECINIWNEYEDEDEEEVTHDTQRPIDSKQALTQKHTKHFTRKWYS